MSTTAEQVVGAVPDNHAQPDLNTGPAQREGAQQAFAEQFG